MIILSGLQKNSKVGKMQSFPGNLHHQKHYKENEKKKNKTKNQIQNLYQPESSFCLRNDGACGFIN